MHLPEADAKSSCKSRKSTLRPGFAAFASKAFQKWSNVKNIFWDENLKLIEKDAFNECSGLEVFCCGCFDDKQQSAIVNLKVHDSIKKDSRDKIVKDDFAVQTCAFSKEISFTENPFEDCPEELTFICEKGSEVERFARENGYGFINA